MKKYFLYILALFTICACSQDLEVPFPKHQPKLTLNAFLVEGGGFNLLISRSFGTNEALGAGDFLDEEDLIIADATVEVWKEGKPFTTLHYADTLVIDTFGIFREYQGGLFYQQDSFLQRSYFPRTSIPALKAFDNYEFKATHPLYGNASATVKVMPRPEVLAIRVVKDSVTVKDLKNNFECTLTAILVTLKDPEEVDNAYEFTQNLETKYSGDTLSSGRYGGSGLYTGYKQSVEGEIVYEFGPIFDEEFNGKVHTLTLWSSLGWPCGKYLEPDKSSYVYPYSDLRTFLLDLPYSQFLKKHSQQRSSRSRGLEEALLPTEPVGVPGNVKGGYGLVASFGVAVSQIEIE